MKPLTPFYLCLLSLVLLTTGPLHAEKPNPETRESRVLMQMLRMNDAELAKLRETVQRIEAMSPEERTRMREHLKQLREMEPEAQAKLRERVESIPEAEREKMRQRWKEMSREERMAWRQKLKAMTPEERRAAMAEVGFVPGHMRSRPEATDNAESDSKPRKGPPPPLD